VKTSSSCVAGVRSYLWTLLDAFFHRDRLLAAPTALG
jgi:hypothetical protein